jgi:hypothetical protein
VGPMLVCLPTQGGRLLEWYSMKEVKSSSATANAELSILAGSQAEQPSQRDPRWQLLERITGGDQFFPSSLMGVPNPERMAAPLLPS